MCVCLCVCVCKVIDLVKDSPMEAPVSLHPHQAIFCTSSSSLHPHAPRLIFFFLKKGKLLSQRNREGFTELCNRKTRAHARTRARTYARTHTHKPHMAKQAREVGLVHDLPHLLQGEQWGPVSCATASQEKVAEDLYSVCVWGVCVCVYLLTNFSPRLSCTVSRLFITLHKNKLQVY